MLSYRDPKNPIHHSTPEERFWNDPNIVKEFTAYPPSIYWNEFLCSIHERSSKRALDLGCGGGRNTQLLCELGFDVYACDSSVSMVESTRKRMRSHLFEGETERRIVQASFLALPYPKTFFDIVIANGIFHNSSSVKQEINGIDAASRVIKKGGYLCINVFYRGTTPSEFEPVDDDMRTYITREGLHITLLTASELVDAISRAGFKPCQQVKLYESAVSTGIRSVFRGVFQKA